MIAWSCANTYVLLSFIQTFLSYPLCTDNICVWCKRNSSSYMISILRYLLYNGFSKWPYAYITLYWTKVGKMEQNLFQWDTSQENWSPKITPKEHDFEIKYWQSFPNRLPAPHTHLKKHSEICFQPKLPKTPLKR